MTTSDVRDTLIRDLIADSPLVISVKKSEPISACLEILEKEDISVLGVTDDEGDCFVGLVTLFDIATYVALGAYKEEDNPDDIKASKSLSTPIGDVTGVFHTETNRIWSFEEDLPITKILEPMSKGVHRAVIVTADEKFKLISQTDIVKFGLLHRDVFSDTNKSVEELGLGNPATSTVVTITTESTALRGFRKMEMEQKTAVPVVDPETGAVVTTLSASDIRKIKIDNISVVLKSVTEFLQSIHGELKAPITCTSKDPLASVMHKLVTTHHHHCWVVDAEQRPIASVSLSDIINRLQGIDEDLQSRALAVYGRGAMTKLFETKVLISGLNGLGAEIAKNVILANVNSITLHDTKNTEFADLSSHFYLTELDVGKNRAASCQAKLAELNPSVRVVATDEELSEQLIAQHNIVVLIEASNDDAIKFDKYCREKQIAFIKTDIVGLAGYVFCDFGKDFLVTDTTGENPGSGIVKEITPDGRVQCVNDEHLDFQDGDFVTFTEVKGTTELNSGEYVISRVTPYSFFIEGVDKMQPYISGGIVTQVKKDKVLQFKSYADSLNEWGFVEPPDYSKFDRPQVLFNAFRALDHYKREKGEYPAPANDADATAFIEYFKQYNQGDTEVEYSEALEKVLKYFAHGARAVVNPMAAMFGGIVGQEVIKAATGKFHPIDQWFLFDSFESLPDTLLPADEYQLLHNRYDGQVMLMGKTFQEKYLNQKYFLVGSGALGCEFLKNFAMTGLGCGPDGWVTITDDDVIEKSNLSRQFLFRNWHIHQSKSICASDSAKLMNPTFNVIAKQDRVSPLTEHVFDDDFWNSLDGVCGALDNVKARLYVDSRCVFYEKPLLESGTLGTKCHSQVVLPHKTQHYGAQPDQPEKEAPVCILHNFPHNIQHCLTWGRSEFNGNFEIAPAEVNKYLSEPDYIESLKKANVSENDIKEKLQVISKATNYPCKTFEDCIKWARQEFQENFVNRIAQLLYNFPEDAKTSTGAPFWSPPKRFPKLVEFDADDAVHMQFIIAAANLRAASFNIERPKQNRKPEYFKEILKNVTVSEFVPQKKKIQTEATEKVEDDATVESLLAGIPAPSVLQGISMEPEEFEKDDDTNFHMDFIGAAANLRARNYAIEEVDKLKAKLIAGRIIPAIATATALATGLVMLEIFKIVNDKQMGDFATVGSYRNSSINLALPQFSFFEPLAPEKIVDHVEKNIPDPINHPDYVEEEDVVAYPPGHTIWDKLHVRLASGFTLQDFIDHFQKDHGLQVDMISFVHKNGSAALVYGSSLKNTHANLAKRFVDLVHEKTGELVEHLKYFIPAVLLNKDGDTVDTPPIVVHF